MYVHVMKAKAGLFAGGGRESIGGELQGSSKVVTMEENTSTVQQYVRKRQ